ncbi:hypothetical protein BVRB_4g085400 [Beta vulgaris subsp. vulgaris]|nr:hypothetical protein BVRB_4g085400 [Beta vulgaris subsp. vulgaris]
MLQFCCPQMHTANWRTISQPNVYFRNNQETVHQPFLNDVAPTENRRGGLKVSPDNSECVLSLLSAASERNQKGSCVTNGSTISSLELGE